MLRRPRAGTALALLASAFAVAPAHAIASVRDRAATRAYVLADYALARASKSLPQRGPESLERFAATVSAECPRALAGAPSNGQSDAIRIEVVFAELQAFTAPVRPALERFTATVRRLRWDDAHANRLVHSELTSGEAVLLRPRPHLCADITSWVSSGYRRMPGEAQRDAQLTTALAGETPRQSLARYETRAEKRLVRRTEVLNRKTGRAYLARYNAIVATINRALGLRRERHGEIGHLKEPSSRQSA